MVSRSERMTKTNEKRRQGLATAERIHQTNPRSGRGYRAGKTSE